MIWAICESWRWTFFSLAHSLTVVQPQCLDSCVRDEKNIINAGRVAFWPLFKHLWFIFQWILFVEAQFLCIKMKTWSDARESGPQHNSNISPHVPINFNVIKTAKFSKKSSPATLKINRPLVSPFFAASCAIIQSIHVRMFWLMECNLIHCYLTIDGRASSRTSSACAVKWPSPWNKSKSSHNWDRVNNEPSCDEGITRN